jgi:maltose operon periplasmic protein
MGMTQGKQSWLWLVGLLATGCSGIDSPHALTAPSTVGTFQQQALMDRQQLAQTSAIEKFQGLTFQPLGDVNTWVQIGSSNQVFSFDTGKSYVAAFSLPTMAQASRVKLIVPIDFTLFLPSVMILDEHFMALQVVPSSTFKYARDNLMAGQNLQGEFTIPAKTGSSRPAYMLIFTTTQDMQSTTKIDTEVLQKAMEYGRTSDVARFLNSDVPHAATGRLRLSFDDQTAAMPPPQLDLSSVAYAAAVKPRSESEYYQQIRDAVAKKEYEKALALVQAAEKAGFNQAKDVFFSAQQ